MMAEAVISGLGVACRLPLTVAAERGMYGHIKGLEQAVENLSRISKTAVPGAAAMVLTALRHPRYRSLRHRLPVRQRYAGNW
ncbi:hypothetical protein [Escherichia coli]|uniref:hypothetical protein n=1 Tax=Escherichia coli TaxID=562 RepID=UPI00388E2748